MLAAAAALMVASKVGMGSPGTHDQKPPIL